MLGHGIMLTNIIRYYKGIIKEIKNLFRKKIRFLVKETTEKVIN